MFPLSENIFGNFYPYPTIWGIGIPMFLELIVLGTIYAPAVIRGFIQSPIYVLKQNPPTVGGEFHRARDDGYRFGPE